MKKASILNEMQIMIDMGNFSQQRPGVKAILLMGGAGERFASAIPKQFHRLSGKKIYLYTLEAFLETGVFEEVILVTHASWVEEVREEIRCYTQCSLRVIEGGKTRQQSSYQGLLACGKGTQIVVIHDAVRPFISKRIIEENIQVTLQKGAVDTCIPSADTLVYAPGGTLIEQIPDRAQYLRGQTPQTFQYQVIMQAHQHSLLSTSSDDCRLVREMGHPVAIVRGDESNIKITTQLDLLLAEQILRFGQHKNFSQGATTQDLQGKVIAIPGGTGGIGSALCFLLEQEGAIALPLGRSSADHPVDLTDSQSVQSCFQAIHRRYGALDGLINCAGLLKRKGIAMHQPLEIEELVAVNLSGPIFCCQYAVLKKGSHILNIASSSYLCGRKETAIYSSAKAALVNFSQGLAEEYPELIVSVVAPQRTNTHMRRSAFPDEDVTTLLSPEEVAKEIIAILKRVRQSGGIYEVRK